MHATCCPECFHTMYLPDESFFGLKGKCPECGHKFELYPIAAEITDLEKPPEALSVKSSAAESRHPQSVPAEASHWPPAFDDSLDPHAAMPEAGDDESVNFDVWDREEPTFSGPNPFQLEQVESRESAAVPEDAFDENDADAEFSVSGVWNDDEDASGEFPPTRLIDRLPDVEKPSTDPQFTWKGQADLSTTNRHGQIHSTGESEDQRDSFESDTDSHFELEELPPPRSFGPLTRVWQGYRQNPIASALIVASMTLLLLGMGFLAHFAIQAHDSAGDLKARLETELANDQKLSEENMAQAAVKPHWPLAPEASFSPDGTEAATLGTDGVVRLWDLKTGRIKNRFAPAKDPKPLVYRVLFNAEGSRWLSLSDDNIARVWDPSRDQTPLELPHDSTIRHAAFCQLKDSSQDAGEAIPGICTVTLTNDLFLWDAETGVLLHHEPNIGEVLALFPTGEFALVARDANLVLFNVPSASIVKEWPGSH